jgi:hypothetical protein
MGGVVCCAEISSYPVLAWDMTERFCGRSLHSLADLPSVKNTLVHTERHLNQHENQKLGEGH